jgi:peroxiredoxin
MFEKFFLILIYVLAPCIALSQNNLSIKGQVLNNSSFSTIYFENIITKVDLDSAAIQPNGEFILETKLESPEFYKLRFNQENYILIIPSPGETIEIVMDMNNLFEPQIKGSLSSQSVYTTYGKMKEFDREKQELSKRIDEKKKEYLRQYILNNLNSLSCLFFIENLSIEDDLEIYKKLDKSLTSLYPGHPLVANLRERVKTLTLLSIGSEAPEIDLPGLKGKNIKLSSLRGKYVLIDFWAAWCGPCRKESPHLVALYKEFNKKGFEIYSVSLDNNKKDWEAAIKKDGLGNWVHVSDLKYWNNLAAKEYGVEAIPFTVLIDKEGKIIEKGLRGDALKLKLKELLTKSNGL